MKICTTTEHKTIYYAKSELEKYITRMLTEEAAAELCFSLGLLADMRLDASDVDDPALDDVIYISTDATGGIIGGSNPRSVLLAVYEYLRQNGCRWLLPGKDGEYIPRHPLTPVKYRHKADMRFRGPCIEGATSRETVLEVIDFLPKIGMNLFMSQFAIPYEFYRRYYSHEFNPAREPETIDRDTVAEFKREFEKEISLRGLQFHDIGHGFTSMPFGVTGADTWESGESISYPPESEKYFAQVNGERKLYRGLPLYTNICMSNAEARKMVADFVADFASKHKEITELHVWLGDSFNAHCECEACVKKRPSDWYVILLNDIDRKLTARGLETRIVFAMSADGLWAPECERINNRRRFTLMLAPYPRVYTATLTGKGGEIPEYKRNDISLPTSLDGHLAHYAAWRESFSGSSFVYDYHFWRYQYLDVSGLNIAKRIFEDIACYRERGLDGMVACGSLRSFFPSGLAVYTMARALFDKSLSFEDIRNDYLGFAYGEVAEDVLKALSDISDAFGYEYMSGMECADRSIYLYYNPSRAEHIGTAYGVADRLRRIISSASEDTGALRHTSLSLLSDFADFVDMMADYMIPLAKGDKTAAREKYDFLAAEMGKREERLKPFFDQWLGIAYLERPVRTDDKFW